MVLFGLLFMAIGSLGVGAAVAMEIKTGESIYKILMKVFPWVFAVGAILLAVGL